EENKENKIISDFPSSEDEYDDVSDVLIKILVDTRNELRARKIYDLADDIRCKLLTAGIQLEDSTGGVRWKSVRVNE
ncbi:MAG: hypothetical protein MJY54_03250, partial [archaeon]|nr:hypothetical protein [archaeon]